MNNHDWLLKRNCSLSPRQLGLAYAILSLLSLAIALAFTQLYGAWQVLAYAMLEMTAVALAFIHYARHATDKEHIALIENCLLIERVEAGQLQQVRLDPFYTRIASPTRMQDLIGLDARGVKIEVGRFVTHARRQQVARELRRALCDGGIRAGL